MNSRRVFSCLMAASLLAGGALLAQSHDEWYNLEDESWAEMLFYDDPGQGQSGPDEENISRKGMLAFQGTVSATVISSINSGQKALFKKLDDRAEERAAAEGAAASSYGFSAWLAPYYRHTHRSGMEADGSVSKEDSGGSGFGLDIPFGNLVIGGAFDAGYTRSTYTYHDTSMKNDSDYFGITMYADWAKDKLRVYGGLGFSYDDHDFTLEQKDYEYRVRYKKSTDSTTYAINWALIGEYKVYDKAVYVTPYLGVRHAFIDTESYKIGMVNFDSDSLNIFRFPLGVKVGHLFNFSGFTLRPQANLSVEPVVGDTKSTTKIHSRAVGTSDTTKARMTDDLYYDASIGVTAGFYGIALTLAYDFHGSAHETEHGVSLTYNWRF